MKSRISIDVNEDNQPIIKIEWNESDDVRDKLVKRYLEKFGTDSHIAKFQYENWFIENTTNNRLASITPLSLKELRKETKLLNLYFDDIDSRSLVKD